MSCHTLAPSFTRAGTGVLVSDRVSHFHVFEPLSLDVVQVFHTPYNGAQYVEKVHTLNPPCSARGAGVLALLRGCLFALPEVLFARAVAGVLLPIQTTLFDL